MYVYKNIYFVAVLLCALRQLDRFRTHIFTEFFARSQASQDLFKQLGAPSRPMGFPHGKTMGYFSIPLGYWFLPLTALNVVYGISMNSLDMRL
jgi:hypothetical protein